MKKAIFVLLAIALAGLAAFADDAAPAAPAVPAGPTVKLSVGVFTGAYYNGMKNTIMSGDSDSYAPAWSRFNFSGDISQGDMGAKFTIRKDQYLGNSTASGTYDSTKDPNAVSVSLNAFKLRRAYGYYNLLEGKVQVQAGRVGNGDFSTSWYGAAPFDNGDTGALVTVKPVPGLEIGGLLAYGASGQPKFDEVLKYNTAVGVMYTFGEVATAQIAFRNFYNHHGNADFYVVGDLNITAIKDLTLSAEFQKNDQFDYDEYGTVHVIEHVAYTIGKLTPSIIGYQVFITDKDAAATSSGIEGIGFNDNCFYIQPGVAYAYTDKITLGADIKYGNIENYWVDGTPTQTAEKSKPYASFDAYAKYDLGKGYIKVKPGYSACEDHNYGGFSLATVFEASL